MTEDAGAGESRRPVIMPGLLAQAKLIFGFGDAVYVIELDGTHRLVSNTALQAAKAAFFQWILGARDRDLEALNVELVDTEFPAESALFGPWVAFIGDLGIKAVNVLAEQLAADPELRVQNAERKEHQGVPEWLSSRHAAQTRHH
jgi:hypothetical protein